MEKHHFEWVNHVLYKHAISHRYVKFAEGILAVGSGRSGLDLLLESSSSEASWEDFTSPWQLRLSWKLFKDLVVMSTSSTTMQLVFGGFTVF